MEHRSGEKIGWIGGWSGAFVWLLLLSGIWLAQGLFPRALVGLTLLALGLGSIIALAPWRHPHTPFRLLMLPGYVVLLLAVIYAVAVTEEAHRELSWWSITWLLPLLIPMITAGGRTWQDGEQ